MPKVQIVIPAINLWKEHTLPAIESVVRSAVKARDVTKEIEDYRIFILDNGSTDGTRDGIIEITKGEGELSDHLVAIRSDRKRGFQESINQGINAGFSEGYSLELVLNNDVLLHEDTISELVYRIQSRLYETSKEVVMVTGHNIRDLCSTPESLDSKVSGDWQWTPESEHPDFSCFMINKECWDLVGEFDELFAPAYFEDNDYHYRINLSNVRAVNVPKAIYYHYGSATQKTQNVVTNASFEANRMSYRIKWGDIPGHEKFTNPFDDRVNSIRSTKQNKKA